MSLIYDALRKSEEQRRAGEVPSLSTPVWQPRRRPPTRWPLIAGVAFVALAFAVYFGVRDEPASGDVATAEGRDSTASGDTTATAAGTTGATTAGADRPTTTDVNRRPRRDVVRPVEAPTSNVAIARPSDGGREIVKAQRARRHSAKPPRAAMPAIVDAEAELDEIERKFEQGEIFANNAAQLRAAQPTQGGGYVPPEAALPEPLPEPEATAPEPPRDPNRMTARELVQQRRAERAAAAAAPAVAATAEPNRPTRRVTPAPAATTAPSGAGATTGSSPAGGSRAASSTSPSSSPAAASPPPAAASNAAVAANALDALNAAPPPNQVAMPGTPNSPSAVASAPSMAANVPSQPLSAVPAPPRPGAPTIGPPPTPSTSNVPTPRASAPGIDPSLPPVQLVYELPLAMRQSLPELKLNMHVYNADPARRFVIIDGTRAAEGQPLSQGLDVAEIRPDGIVLRYQNQTFLLPRGGR